MNPRPPEPQSGALTKLSYGHHVLRRQVYRSPWSHPAGLEADSRHDVNGLYRGRGGLKLLMVVGVIWGGVSAATYVMHRVGGAWAYIPAIVIGAGLAIAVLLFRLIGPLS